MARKIYLLDVGGGNLRIICGTVFFIIGVLALNLYLLGLLFSINQDLFRLNKIQSLVSEQDTYSILCFSFDLFSVSTNGHNPYS